MSRGLGTLQRSAGDALYAAEGYELSIRELRRQLGEPDRSNLRRAVRGLLERGIVEEDLSRGKRRIKLTGWGETRARFSWAAVYRVHFEFPVRRQVETSVPEETLDEEHNTAKAETAEDAKDSGWVGYEHRPVRDRRPGPVQERILRALWEHADPVDEGLPVAAVKAMSGGDRSNARRAIRTLLLRGYLEESENGKRVRLSRAALGSFSDSESPPDEGPVSYGRA